VNKTEITNAAGQAVEEPEVTRRWLMLQDDDEARAILKLYFALLL
jgi:hypothetical protein